jgi:phage terminase Nu1 subunit (DNA packaging protein)
MLTRQQRITQEIKNEILEGRAIPVEAARDVLTKILARIGSTLDSLAPNIKRRHPEIEQRIIDFIKSETIKYQNEASKLDSYLDDIIDEVVTEAEAKV